MIMLLLIVRCGCLLLVAVVVGWVVGCWLLVNGGQLLTVVVVDINIGWLLSTAVGCFWLLVIALKVYFPQPQQHKTHN